MLQHSEFSSKEGDIRFRDMYTPANDPRTTNDPQIGPQTIFKLARKRSLDRKWSPYQQGITYFFLITQ